MLPRLTRPPIALFALLFLSACGAPPEPDYLEGEERAGPIVIAFLQAVERGDFDAARLLLYPRPDYILSDLERCQELFFARRATGMSVLNVGRELYGSDWHIAVDVKISYGSEMKPLRFTVTPGLSPQLRGVNPLRQ